MTNFSKDQLDKIRTLLDKVGVKPECPACKQGMMVLDRGQFGLKEVGFLLATAVALSECTYWLRSA